MDKDTIDYILNLLRKGTITWSGRSECLRMARKKVREPSGKEKFYWQCAVCKQWYRDVSDLEVDHIVEVGPFSYNIDDLGKYASRMYCGQENLQALCIICHKKKTSCYNATLMFQRKKKS